MKEKLKELWRKHREPWSSRVQRNQRGGHTVRKFGKETDIMKIPQENRKVSNSVARFVKLNNNRREAVETKSLRPYS